MAEVVGVVIGEEQGFVQQGLVVGVRDRSEYIRCGIFDFGGELFAVGAEGSDALLPGFCVGRFRGFWPIARRKVGGDMLGVESVFDDVPLGDAEMLEEFPG